MNEQTIILFFLILSVVITLFLYMWKAKKEIEYKKDERWKMIQLKANNAANCVNYILILLIAVGDTILLYMDTEVTLTLSRVFLYATFFIGLRNAIEMIALKYYDKKL